MIIAYRSVGKCLILIPEQGCRFAKLLRICCEKETLLSSDEKKPLYFNGLIGRDGRI